MNENLDLTKILDGYPEGSELYSPLIGPVKYVSSDNLIITVSAVSILGVSQNYYFTADGKYADALFENGECLLFPSKDQRDWSKFERFWDKPKGGKFDPNTLRPFDRVLVKDYRNDAWVACLFSHKANNSDDGWFICDNTYWNYVIPYNDDTKHLVGTKEDCPEYYKWWEE